MPTTRVVRPPVASSEATGIFASGGTRVRTLLACAVLLFATACTGNADADALLIMSTIAALLLFAGVGIGVLLALLLLRAADTATAKYHRAALARVLDASNGVHALVQETVATAQARIVALRRELRQLKEGA